MQVYLAAAWSRKDEIKKIADELIALGINVQARWLNEPPTLPERRSPTSRESFLRSRAEIDIEDATAADVLVRFSDDLTPETVPAKLATGSRMFEMGWAMANGSQIVVVGGHQCVFDWLPTVRHLPDVEILKEYLVKFKRDWEIVGGE
jgi:hypothetical protein